MIDRVKGVGQVMPVGQTPPQAHAPGAKASFGEIMSQVRQESAQPSAPPQSQGINFSKHAISRAEERGIELTPDLMDKLAGSVERAQEKGAVNILAFGAEQAFIINVPHNRVITTISQAEMKEKIFTNIDAAILL